MERWGGCLSIKSRSRMPVTFYRLVRGWIYSFSRSLFVRYRLAFCLYPDSFMMPFGLLKKKCNSLLSIELGICLRTLKKLSGSTKTEFASPFDLW